MSNVKFPRALDRSLCRITNCHMQLVNCGNGTLKIEHPTNIAPLVVAIGAVEDIAQHWRLILLGFDPLTLGCTTGYTNFREQRFPQTNGGEEYDIRFNPR